MSILITLIIFVILAGLLWWALTMCLTAFNVPAPFATIAQVLFILLCVVFIIDRLGLLGGSLRL